MAKDTFDDWVKKGTPVGGETAIEVPFTTHRASFVAERGKKYYNICSGKTFTLLGGSEPMRRVDGPGKMCKCSVEQMDGYAIANVRYETGHEAQLDPDNFGFFIDNKEWLSKPPMAFWTYDDMLSLPEPQWLVEGAIQKQTSALIFGASNAFKSFLGIDLMMHAATGKDWHGHTVSEAVPCVYVATEGSHGVGAKRIPGWIEHHGLDDANRYNFLVCPDEIALDDEASVTSFLKTCAHWKAWREINAGNRVMHPDDHKGAVGLVVIDIFGASMMGPETSDETARLWVKAVNRIIREMNCAVLTVAHTGWADQTRARMHTHFWGSFDTRLKAEGDKESLTTVLKVDRHKDADSTGEWGFRLDKVTLPNGQTTLVPRLCDDVEVKQKRRASGKPAMALQALSEALIDQGRTISGPNYPSCPVVTIDQWSGMCRRHGLTDSDNPETIKKAFQRAKNDLIEKGFVKQFDNNVWKVSADD
jgi:hypothetical protein